jgi:hypothetical protein
MPARIRRDGQRYTASVIAQARPTHQQAAGSQAMTTVIIAALAIIALYLGKRWSDTNVENTQLRAQVASLKKQLARRDR